MWAQRVCSIFWASGRFSVASTFHVLFRENCSDETRNRIARAKVNIHVSYIFIHMHIIPTPMETIHARRIRPSSHSIDQGLDVYSQQQPTPECCLHPTGRAERAQRVKLCVILRVRMSIYNAARREPRQTSEFRPERDRLSASIKFDGVRDSLSIAPPTTPATNLPCLASVSRLRAQVKSSV